MPELSAGGLVLDPEGICVGHLGSVHRLLGQAPDWTPTGRHVGDLIGELAERGDFGPRIAPGSAPAGDFFLSPEFEDIYLDTPDGRIVAPAVSAWSGGWLVTLTDMTRMKTQARQLFRAQKALAESEARSRELADAAAAASRAKGAFLAAMSHEIRTPMSGVIGMAELLEETELTAEQAAHVQCIRQSAGALLGIIGDILDFSKIEAGRMTLASEPFDLLEVIEEVVTLCAANARSRALDFAIGYPAGLTRRFVGDALRVRQILFNVIGNAVKFTPAGAVEVGVSGTAAAERTALCIEVADSGIGIAPENLDRIFGEFDRVEDGLARRFEGTGLGLAITRRLVRQMGGEVLVRSTPGAGTTFTVRLDLPASGPGPGPEPEAAPLSGRRILVIDRLATNRRMAMSRLGRAGASVVAVPDASGLDRLAASGGGRTGFDAVICDRQAGATLDPLRSLFPGARLIGGPAGSRQRGLDGRISVPLKPSVLVRETAAALGIAQDRRSGRAPPPRRGTARAVVLVAEDNRTNRLILSRLLASAPVELHFARDGAEAVRMARELLPDLVFMDVSMPEMDGYAATRALRAEDPASPVASVPIIALTANTLDEERRRGAACGMDGYLTKPVRRDELLAAIDRYAPAGAAVRGASAETATGSGPAASMPPTRSRQ